MEDNAAQQPDESNDTTASAAAGPVSARNPVSYARPALIAGAAVAAVCIALLVIIFALDSFNAAAYSVTGNSINDATQEARDIREQYTGVRIGGIIVLIVSAAVALAGAVVLYLNRGSASAEDGDDGEDVDLDDLTRE
ncbi:hypothetical protein [Arthrobacter sp. CJ23]|uniref:hypothetical protein n=1 Tax=Arthrobacter sp. CJ23 TaxID=2972479 RepID=UPI00215BC857|nr:hypothetical protein [Arthrobacter sp. CJ23]UVJ38491.1 hypothetical protein NVV90_14805 [Arthrobacter sp. CJ23]